MKMSQSLISNRIHIVFSTHGRKPSIPAAKKNALWAYIVGVCRNHKVQTLAIGGMEDHLHILLALPPVLPLSTVVQKIKANSSRWMRSTVKDFAWQKGYGAFGTSTSHVKITIEYIRNQEKHHQRRDFKIEFLEFLRKNEVDYDPRYVFE